MLHRLRPRISDLLRWAVLIAVCLAVSSRGRSQEKPDDRVKSTEAAKSAGAAESPAAAPLVARILTSWKAREDRTKTLHCLWDTTEVRNGKPVERGALVTAQGECWIGRDNHCRFQMTTERAGPKGIKERSHHATAYDGRVNFILDGKEPSKLPRRGKIWEFKGRIDFFSREMRPLDWVYRPSATVNLNPEQFRLVTQDAIVNGLRYTKLRGSNKFGRPAGSFWFNPRQDDALVYWELNGSGTNKLPMSLRYAADKAKRPTLAGWTVLQDDGSDAIAKLKTLEINKVLPADTFQIPFPAGTAVAVDDGPTQEASIVKPDGTKRTIFKLNSIPPRLRACSRSESTSASSHSRFATRSISSACVTGWRWRSTRRAFAPRRSIPLKKWKTTRREIGCGKF